MSLLKSQVIKGIGWVTAGYVASQAMRLVSNLVLTRALAPEHFGAMSIVLVFNIGLSMFTDIGVGPNIIQGSRGKEPRFLNAAWSLQITHGFGLWLICILAAWPMSTFYDSPTLLFLLPAAGFSFVIQGFNSVSIFTAQRDLQVARLTVIELLSQIGALLVMLLTAHFWQSIWVLVFGGWTSALIKMTLSHVWLDGPNDRWCWDTKIFSEFVHFGKWIFLSTMLSFAGGSSASMVLGKFVSLHDVGLFSIAATLAKAVEQAYQQVAQRILFPLYGQIHHLPREELLQKVLKIRLGIVSLFVPILLIFVLFSQFIINFLFDNRYHDAAWIFRLYSLGTIPIIVTGLGPFYLAIGKPHVMTILSGIRLICYIGSMMLGWYAAGVSGLVAGMSCFTFFSYAAEAAAQQRFGIWLPKIDILVFGLSATVIGIFYLLFGFQ